MYLPTSTVGNWFVSTRSGYVRHAVILTLREIETHELALGPDVLGHQQIL